MIDLPKEEDRRVASAATVSVERRSGRDRRKADRDAVYWRWDQEPDQSPLQMPEQMPPLGTA